MLSAHRTDFIHVCTPCSCIQRRTSSTRQTVTRAESFSGAGNVPAHTRRHKVDLDIGMNVNTCGWRRKPISGSIALVGNTADMIRPFTGARTRFKIGDDLPCRDHAKVTFAWSVGTSSHGNTPWQSRPIGVDQRSRSCSRARRRTDIRSLEKNSRNLGAVRARFTAWIGC